MRGYSSVPPRHLISICASGTERYRFWVLVRKVGAGDTAVLTWRAGFVIKHDVCRSISAVDRLMLDRRITSCHLSYRGENHGKPFAHLLSPVRGLPV